MAVEDIEGEDEGVLGVVEEGHHVYVHDAGHHADPHQNQQETHLSVSMHVKAHVI